MKKLSSFNRILLCFFLFIGLMIAYRILYTGSFMHLFMCWNIFLAWIPYALSNYFKHIKEKAKWKQVLLFTTWLLFFPNALYIVTDIIHMTETTNIPLWYDAVLLFASSFIGVIMAFISLRKVEFFLLKTFTKTVVVFIIPVILFTASFGVYLGRFQRWNSWDIIQNPLALAKDILGNFIYPVHNYKTWAITILFTGIYAMLYFFLKYLPEAFREGIAVKGIN